MIPVLEEVYSGIYKAEIPLPKNPLRTMNSYIIKDKEKNLIIDTGFNHPECIKTFELVLKELNITEYDIFLTHMHIDHCGLVNNLATKKTQIMCSQMAGDLINLLKHKDNGKKRVEYLIQYGFPVDEFKSSSEKIHPAYMYSEKGLDFIPVKDGDIISTGRFNFTCIETPGHSPGHICLYEPEKKILISGDHILLSISPNISVWPQMFDSLGEYLKSLDKVYPLDVELILPAHRNTGDNHRQRIVELKKHHEKRVGEIIDVLRQGNTNAYQIASQLKWNMSDKAWENVHLIQKIFATSEVAAHLEYMTVKNLCKKENSAEGFIYSL